MINKTSYIRSEKAAQILLSNKLRSTAVLSLLVSFSRRCLLSTHYLLFCVVALGMRVVPLSASLCCLRLVFWADLWTRSTHENTGPNLPTNGFTTPNPTLNSKERSAGREARLSLCWRYRSVADTSTPLQPTALLVYFLL